jgi:putative ABC transport system permease protein
VDATQLIQPGSRVTYAALFAGPAPAVAAFREYLQARQGAGERLREVDESSRQLNSAIDRASRFPEPGEPRLGAARRGRGGDGRAALCGRHIDTVALMKCMGASQGFVLAMSVIELTLLALAAVAAGAAARASSRSRGSPGCCGT